MQLVSVGRLMGPRSNAGAFNYVANLVLTRATTGRFFDSDALIESAAIDATRTQHDITQFRENLLRYSQDFTDSVWKFSNAGTSTVGDQAVAPDGTTTADEIRESTSTGVHRIYGFETAGIANNVFIVGRTYTVSFHLKANGRSKCVITAIMLTSASATIDLAAETNSNGSIQSLGNDWYRVTLSGTASAANLNLTLSLDNGSGTSYTGDGTSGMFIWGAQAEEGSSATSYIATGSARAATAPVLGTYVTPALTNYTKNSEDFDASTWKFSPANITVSTNVAIAPDGATTADKVVENSDTAQVHRIWWREAAFTATSGQDYTFVLFARASGRTRFSLTMGGGWSGSFDVDLTAETVSGAGRITALPLNWYRVEIPQTASSTGTPNVVITLQDASGNTTYDGDGTSGVIFWGGMVVDGDISPDYIPTTSASVTRAADDVSLDLTTVSAFIPGGYTVVLETTVYALDGIIAEIGLGTTQEVAFDMQAGELHMVGPSALDVTGAIGLAIGDTVKIAARVQTNSMAVSVNGDTAATDNTHTIAGTSEDLTIGQNLSGADGCPLVIKTLNFLPPKSDSQLEGLSA